MKGVPERSVVLDVDFGSVADQKFNAQYFVVVFSLVQFCQGASSAQFDI